jgi:tRNA(Ile)-lysidine synthase
LSIQEAAREIRYDWFRGFLVPGIADKARRFVLTAHHADDDVETLLQHFFQGTGIAGLHGTPSGRGGVVRPLLFAGRKELEDYARDNGLTWVEDSSNATVKYTRNAIRHELLPAIEKVFPKVRENLMDNLGRFREIENLYRQGLDRHLKRLLFEVQGGWKIPFERLRHTEPLRTIVWELFSRFGFTVGQSSGIIDLLDSPSGRFMDSSTHRVLRDRKWLLVSPLQEQLNGVRLIEQGQEVLAIPDGEIRIALDKQAGDENVSAEAMIACLDARDVRFPLLVRKWKPGDYFYPLGMRKKQKVARFLINGKVDRIAKEKVLVVESDKRIIWVVGHRIDDRFKITPASRERITLRVVPS